VLDMFPFISTNCSTSSTSKTLLDQRRVERECKKLLDAAINPILQRENHIAYLIRALDTGLPGHYSNLDASRAWVAYWVLQSIDLLQMDSRSASVNEILPGVVNFLSQCKDASGGFGGGPLQSAHVLSTYAAVMALLIIGTEDAFACIDRKAIHDFFLSVKEPSGAFRVESDGEADVRAAYAVVAVCDLLNILSPEIRRGTAEFFRRCQSYEGGFSAEPGNEAHGGYTYCALAGLAILGNAEVRKTNLVSLSNWLQNRQMTVEGGFSGRTNKLVDGCYSFWQGACFPIVAHALFDCDAKTIEATSTETQDHGGDLNLNLAMFMSDTERLQKYILVCSQVNEGGFQDKPGAGRDFYHTCYCLSGLSIAQHYGVEKKGEGKIDEDDVTKLASKKKRIGETHPLYNIRKERVNIIKLRFSSMF
jgi:protein farnesyltransferase subunit beta